MYKFSSLLLLLLGGFLYSFILATPVSAQPAAGISPNEDLEIQTEKGLTQENLEALNPLRIGDTDASDVNTDEFSTPAGILSRFFIFAFPISGMILFVMLVWGGFQTLSGAATKQSMDEGRQRITAALFGFGLLFSSYWIIQIIQAVFSINIISF